MKLHEYAMNKMQLLDPKKLKKYERDRLLQRFETIKNASFPSILDQLKGKFPPRVEIDRAVFRVLGFDDDEIDQILDYLYPALAKEIEQLKKLMAG